MSQFPERLPGIEESQRMLLSVNQRNLLAAEFRRRRAIVERLDEMVAKMGNKSREEVYERWELASSQVPSIATFYANICREQGISGEMTRFEIENLYEQLEAFAQESVKTE